MLFKRSYHYQTTTSIEDIKKSLIGSHVKIHNMDFEVSEKGEVLRIIPHAEQETAIKTLPITHVDMNASGNKTEVKLSFKMRKIDGGGPMLIVIFCLFMLGAAGFFLYIGQEGEHNTVAYTLIGISVVIFGLFWIRMQSGYFDYVRKIKEYVKSKSGAN